MNKVKPELPGGFRDYTAEDMLIKKSMLEIIAKKYQSFGFDPLDTSTVHFKNVLFGDDSSQSDMECFNVRRSNSKYNEATMLSLRFDLTVSLARYVAENLDKLPKPFKRYQVGNVFRAEKPQAGRFCEFMQFDADSMFIESMIADAEIVVLMQEILNALQMPSFKIKINNRKLSDALPAALKFNPKYLWPILRILDKQDKIGWENVRELLLGKKTENETDKKKKPIAYLKVKQVDKLKAYLSFNGNQDNLEKASALFANDSLAEQGIKELKDLMNFALAMGANENNVEIDFSMVRGLAYYTGPIFEAGLTGSINVDGQEINLAKYGTVFGGGRFDNLVSRYTDATVPGTGASVGVDRLFEVVKLLDQSKKKSAVDVMITVLDPALITEYLKIAAMLRQNGLNVLVYSGDDMTIKAQMARALTQNIQWIIFARDELQDKQVSLKNTALRQQKRIPIEKLYRVIKSLDEF